MSLLALPSELLLPIVEYTGPSFFQEDIRRLTICKRWFCFAKIVFLTKFNISATSLERLIDRLPKERVRSRLNQIEEFNVQLLRDRNGCWKQSGVTRLSSYWDQMLGIFAWILEDTSKPHTMTLQIQRTSDAPIRKTTYTPQSGKLCVNSLSRLISLRNITVLELDLDVTTWVLGDRGRPLDPWSRAEHHLCATINSLLVSLHRLRLRLPRICPKVLDLPPDTCRLSLSSVIIDTWHYGDHTEPLSPRPCAVCPEFARGRWALENWMIEQAERLVDRMAHPKVARIVSRNLAGHVRCRDVTERIPV